MTLREGMDTARARGVADQLRRQGDALAAIGDQGNLMTQVLEQAWGGPDAEVFVADWDSARPQIDRAGQAVTELGRELDRQADDQDAASDGSGAAGAAGAGLPGGFPARMPIPPMPTAAIRNPLQPVVDFLIKEWQAIRNWAWVPSWVSDLLSWLDDVARIFTSPLVRALFRGFGVFTAFLGGVITLWDAIDFNIRLMTEGLSADLVLQGIQTLLNSAAAACGITALFATGTIAGAPAGVVLGAAALVFAILGGLVGLVRMTADSQYLRDHPEAIHSGLPPDLIGPKGSGAPISYPRPPRLKWG